MAKTFSILRWSRCCNIVRAHIIQKTVEDLATMTTCIVFQFVRHGDPSLQLICQYPDGICSIVSTGNENSVQCTCGWLLSIDPHFLASTIFRQRKSSKHTIDSHIRCAQFNHSTSISLQWHAIAFAQNPDFRLKHTFNRWMGLTTVGLFCTNIEM